METTSDEAILDHSLLLDDVTLHEDDLTEDAKSQFTCHGEILRAFELNRRIILENDLITPVGRHLFFSWINKLHTECKQVLNYCAANSELLHRGLPNVGPLIICGLPRTGSTLLYNLLACDPDCRAPLFTDMCIEPVPPVTRSNMVEHERRAIAARLSAKLHDQLVGRTNTVLASHPSFPIEEDLHILYQAGILLPLVAVCSARQPELEAWISDETNKNFAYDYHETFLRMLTTVDAPRSHWLLKSVGHCLYLDTLLHHYPHGALVMTHRHLHDVLPSFCTMVWAYANIHVDEADPTSRNTTIAAALRQIDQMIKHIVEFRTRRCNSQNIIFDVLYDDLMEQPISTVRSIYDYFGFRWSNEFEIAMHVWLRDNPQGKQGRHTYSLTQIGRTREDIEAQYADYTNLFLRSPSLASIPVKNNSSEQASLSSNQRDCV